MGGCLASRHSPTQMFLFGSRARAEATSDSDYDILVVLESLSDKKYRLAQQACLALAQAGIATPVDVLFVGRDEFEQLKRVIGTLPNTVADGGKLIYAAA